MKRKPFEKVFIRRTFHLYGDFDGRNFYYPYANIHVFSTGFSRAYFVPRNIEFIFLVSQVEL